MPLDQLIPGLIGTTLCLAGAVAFGRLAWLGRSASGWQQAQGEVVHSVVESRSSRNSGRSFRARIRYRFGSTTGARVYFGDFLEGNQHVAEDLVKRYPLGAKVTVWHAPGDPAQSCLERRIDKRVWLFLIFLSGMTVVIGLALLGNGGGPPA